MPIQPLVFCIISLLFSGLCHAEAQLSLSASSIILSPNQQQASLRLSNIGDQTASFNIDWVDYIMLADGEVKRLQAPQKSAHSIRDYISLSEQKIRLAPGQSHQLNLRLKNIKQAKKIEYFSHLKFHQDYDLSNTDTNNNGAMQSRITMAIPIIWRNNNSPSHFQAKTAKFDYEQKILNIEVERMGPNSIREFVAIADNGKLITPAINLIIYANISSTVFSIDWQSNDPEMQLKDHLSSKHLSLVWLKDVHSTAIQKSWRLDTLGATATPTQ